MGVDCDVPQRESPGPAPLATIIRPMITAATAVAARIVRNQKSRFPRSTKSFGFFVGASVGRPEVALDCGCEAGERRTDSAGWLERRCGEIQGQIV